MKQWLSLTCVDNMNQELVDMALGRRQLNRRMTLEQAVALLWKQGLISVGEMAEKAIARVSGLRQQAKGHKGSDFHDRSDSKYITVTYYRNTAYACLKSLQNKVGTLRVCVYEPKTKSNYYFLIPLRVYRTYKNKGNSMKIWFDLAGQPRSPTRAGSNDLWKWQVTAEEWAGRLKKMS